MRPTEPLERYLREWHNIYATGAGVPEESYYGPLLNLLNEVGGTLKPHVRCVGQLRNTGGGEPDFGLFTQEQIQRGEGEPVPGQKPARGAVEVKAPEESLDDTLTSMQVLRYLRSYGLALVTNFREFRLVGIADGRQCELERFTLAPDAAAFRLLAAHPHKAATEQGEAFFEFLQRAMLFNAPLSAPKDVAWFLASYAREARARVERASVPALDAVRQALEEALGITFQGEKGAHFFRSTLVQTLFYGLFAAWVLWHQRGRHGRFDWRRAGGELHVPMIQVLFEQLSMTHRLRPLGLEEVLERAEALLNRVDAESFFTQFSQEHAIQYFYEPFLQAFDPELRKELGVWYTPAEVVRYMVARVDAVLREELGIADGLADPNVVVLDPCCGTGAYLVEVLRHIKDTLEGRGLGALSELKLKEAAMHRVFGFELLPAPFVVAHLQLGLLLHTLGDALTTADERVGVFLTNALTGWEPPTEEVKRRLAQLTFFSPEIRREVDAAARVKAVEKILVIIGNPPYNGFAGVAVEEERSLTNAYRDTRRAPAPQGQGLNDLYVRFYRMAERQIVERTHRGVVCLISNYSWLDGLSFTGMRERYLDVFDKIWIDCLNGDKYKTGKLTPDGKPDPSIFSTEYNREGIQVGTAIGLLVCTGNKESAAEIKFRHHWGKGKRDELLESLKVVPFNDLYGEITPRCELGFPFTTAQVEPAYISWPLLPDLFPIFFPGVKTSRDDLVVDIDRERLISRMQRYFDRDVRHEEFAHSAPHVMEDSRGYQAREMRESMQQLGLEPSQVVKYCYRPFDVRWLFWKEQGKLLDRPRPDYLKHIFPGNFWIEARQKQPMERFDRGYLTAALADNFGNGLSSFFPLYLRNGEQTLLFSTENGFKIKPNLTPEAQAYLNVVEAEAPELFFHLLATLHTPRYRVENAGALRQDWPRVPLPAARTILLNSAGLGKQVAALLDTDQPVQQVTAGQIRPELCALGVPSRTGNGSLRASELAVTAGWGYAGQGGVTMPARGKALERDYTAEERVTLAEAMAYLGETTFDVYLNDIAYWRNVPSRVWAYTSGGYQVLKKWLSYREQPLLGRALTHDEVLHLTNITRRIAALLLLEPTLDEMYDTVKGDSYDWASTR